MEGTDTLEVFVPFVTGNKDMTTLRMKGAMNTSSINDQPDSYSCAYCHVAERLFDFVVFRRLLEFVESTNIAVGVYIDFIWPVSETVLLSKVFKNCCTLPSQFWRSCNCSVVCTRFVETNRTKACNSNRYRVFITTLFSNPTRNLV